jgi:hypothetical protein
MTVIVVTEIIANLRSSNTCELPITGEPRST